MSVASLAIQDRAPCARSIACKLGNPIILRLRQSQQRPHMLGVESVPPLGSGHSAAGVPDASSLRCAAADPPPVLPGIAPSRLLVAVFSTQKSRTRATRVRGKTPPHSARYALAPE